MLVRKVFRKLTQWPKLQACQHLCRPRERVFEAASLQQRVISEPQEQRVYASRKTDIRLLCPSHLTVRALTEQYQSDKDK